MRVVLVVRLLLIAGILLVSGALLAEPAPCDVLILRAPDKAKAAIEARMRAEPTCETSLVVRVVKTSRGGLYLLAHTPNGHVYELVARDTRTAADLVALWASSREPTTAPPPMVLAPPPIAPPPIAVEPAALAPPALAVPIAPEAIDGAPRSRGAGKWLAVGGILGADVYGARVELDVLGRGGWTAGLAFAGSTMQMVFDTPGGAVVHFRDLRALASVGYTIGRGAWQMRVHAGAGVVHSELTGYLYDGVMTSLETHGLYPVGEAGLEVTRALGAQWAFAAGPLATIYSQTYKLDNASEMLGSRDFDVSLLAGLRRKL